MGSSNSNSNRADACRANFEDCLSLAQATLDNCLRFAQEKRKKDHRVKFACCLREIRENKRNRMFREKQEAIYKLISKKRNKK